MNKKTYVLLAFAGILVVLTMINLVYLKVSISLIKSGKNSKLERPHIMEKVNNVEIISLRSRKDKDNVDVETGEEYKHPNNVLPHITTGNDSNRTVESRPQADEPHHQANNKSNIDSDNVFEPHKHTEPLEEDKIQPTPVVVNQTIPIQPLAPNPTSTEDEPFHYSDKDKDNVNKEEPMVESIEPVSKVELKEVQENSLTISSTAPSTEVLEIKSQPNYFNYISKQGKLIREINSGNIKMIIIMFSTLVFVALGLIAFEIYHNKKTKEMKYHHEGYELFEGEDLLINDCPYDKRASIINI